MQDAIWADDTALNSSCEKPFDLSSKIEIKTMRDFNTRKMIYEKFQKKQFCIQYYIDVWEIILYLQANTHRLKIKNINSLIFIRTIIK